MIFDFAALVIFLFPVNHHAPSRTLQFCTFAVKSFTSSSKALFENENYLSQRRGEVMVFSVEVILRCT